jgi:hypothetical protein
MVNSSESDLLLRVAQKYEQEEYEVVKEPRQNELPFDLGVYRPDLLVKKSDGTGFIIEVKTAASPISIERYREIAEIVAKHKGWRFLLVTGDEQEDMEQLLSRQEIAERKEKSEHLIAIGELEAAFLSLWSIVEALMRRQAEEVLIPIERFPPVSLIKHLFSQGELSIEQFDKAISLVEVRNRLVHGFQTQELDKSVIELQALADDLMNLWDPLPQP